MRLAALWHLGLAIASLLLSVSLARAADPAEYKPTPEGIVLFEKEVEPILKANCYKCHGAEKYKGELSLFWRESTLKGGELGPAISLEKPEASMLLEAINHRGDVQMPPTGKIKPEEIAVLTKWVKSGVPFPLDRIAAKKSAEPAKTGVVTAESKNYWAYKPVTKPEIPAVKNAAWAKQPLDAFILAKLEANGLAPAKPADRVALVRRVYYDLIGLPPTPDEVDAFVNDKSPEAYEKLLDKLLESPQYGVKWGRHWLDVVRYAESNGYERDGAKPFVWRYRDYVIKSFNDDKPYDQFIREQLAGDELPGGSAEAAMATGFYRLGIWDDEPVDRLQARYDGLDDIVATTSQVFLGMTMNCARCHDHKIDPIPQRDYYQMVAFFQDIRHYTNDSNPANGSAVDISVPERRQVYEKELTERRAEIDKLTEELTKIENEAIKKLPAEDQRASEGPERPRIVAKVPAQLDAESRREYSRLRRSRDQLLRRPSPAQEIALGVSNADPTPPVTHILIRGNAHAEGAEVQPAFPEVLGSPAPTFPARDASAKGSGRRTALANWIAAPENQLTSRVMANRLWQHHFGKGIVASSNDFGKFGTLPTHPELLDYLANELVAGGWKLKRMHKLLMLSNTYQMSAAASAEGLKLDPDNKWYWRNNMRRLTAEEVRDTVLAVSGKLNLKMGGESVYAPIPAAVLAGQSVPGNGWGKSPPEEASRRSIFVHVKRSLQVPILATHDAADADSSCPVRYTTTVPTQALGMLNGEFMNEQARFLAERMQKEAPGDVAGQIRRAIRLTTGRQPSDKEVTADSEFVKKFQAEAKLDEKQALTQYCLLLLNTNELVYLD